MLCWLLDWSLKGDKSWVKIFFDNVFAMLMAFGCRENLFHEPFWVFKIGAPQVRKIFWRWQNNLMRLQETFRLIIIISLQRLLLIWVSRIQVEKQSQLYTLAWGELFKRQCKSRFGYHNNLYTLLAVNPRLLVTGCWTTPPTLLWNLTSHVPRYAVCTLLPYKIKRHLKALQGPQF